MNNKIVEIHAVIKDNAERVWQALTDARQMQKWYFNISKFQPELGFKFKFEGGEEHKRYLHLCEVIEVKPNKKLTYTWEYQDYEGQSEVCFELESRENRTILKISHKGLETFTNPDFAPEKFKDGWNFLLKESLKGYLEEGKELRTW